MNLQKNLGLTQQENNVLKAKYAAPVICKLNPDQLAREIKAMLIKMNIITGWTYPDDKLYQAILEDQLKKNLIEDYPDMNFVEMEYAFRHYGTAVKDWGKSINLSLIDEVLLSYKSERMEVSRKEEQKAMPPVQVTYTDSQLEDITREDIENFFQRLRNGYIKPVPGHFKDILVKDGLMKQEDNVNGFFVHRLNNGFKNIYTK